MQHPLMLFSFTVPFTRTSIEPNSLERVKEIKRFKNADRNALKFDLSQPISKVAIICNICFEMTNERVL